jgi:hypothetical protein
MEHTEKQMITLQEKIYKIPYSGFEKLNIGGTVLFKLNA